MKRLVLGAILLNVVALNAMNDTIERTQEEILFYLDNQIIAAFEKENEGKKSSFKRPYSKKTPMYDYKAFLIGLCIKNNELTIKIDTELKDIKDPSALNTLYKISDKEKPYKQSKTIGGHSPKVPVELEEAYANCTISTIGNEDFFTVLFKSQENFIKDYTATLRKIFKQDTFYKDPANIPSHLKVILEKQKYVRNLEDQVIIKKMIVDNTLSIANLNIVLSRTQLNFFYTHYESAINEDMVNFNLRISEYLKNKEDARRLKEEIFTY